MESEQLHRIYLDLTTPHVADACMRLGISVRCAPAGTVPLWSGAHMVGRVRPARHSGSVDVFLEAIDRAEPGEVLVVDNTGRQDEACVGDLVTLEASQAGLSGILIWGLHRDTAELRTIHLPIFSLGALPVGPQRLDPRHPAALESAMSGAHTVTSDDFVLGDDDGVLFVPLDHAEDVAEAATFIRDTERAQATRMHHGTTLRNQADVPAFIASQEANPELTFRQHLRSIGGEIEE